ncbi:Uncharacterised protein [Mycobacteroides abscessus subsp. abscessus]|nr:Uncharacterised protein [Mycobacteroides abscessus subsp. abscessus]
MARRSFDAPVGGILCSRTVAQIGATHAIASIRYSVDRSTHLSSTPASNGPAMNPNC